MFSRAWTLIIHECVAVRRTNVRVCLFMQMSIVRAWPDMRAQQQ